MQEKQINLQEIEAFKRTASLINQQSYPIPTPEEVKNVIGIIETRFEFKPFNRFKNAGVKEGYKKSFEILKNPSEELVSTLVKGEDINCPFEWLETLQDRAIASLTYDYLVGKCSKETLYGVPIKK